MLNSNLGQPNQIRWRAFYTWCRGGFNMGWDTANALANLLPQGLFGLFLEVEPNSQLFNPPKLLTKYLLGPLLGALFLLIALPPALIEGVMFKRSFKKNNDEWATKFVTKQGVNLFWGALAVSALWLIAISTGYLLSAINSALFIPLAVSYGLVCLGGLSNGLVNLFGSMIQLYVYRTKDLDWKYNMKGLVDIRLDKSTEDVKVKLNQEFQDETVKMSELFDHAYAKIVQERNHPPTTAEINECGVLSLNGLQDDQNKFLIALTKDRKLSKDEDKLAAIDKRHTEFNAKYRLTS